MFPMHGGRVACQWGATSGWEPALPLFPTEIGKPGIPSGGMLCRGTNVRRFVSYSHVFWSQIYDGRNASGGHGRVGDRLCSRLFALTVMVRERLSVCRRSCQPRPPEVRIVPFCICLCVLVPYERRAGGLWV